MDLLWRQLMGSEGQAELETRLKVAQHKLQLEWLDRDLLGEALTTSAFLVESPRHPYRHQQWLEFLGDGVLRTVIRRYFAERLPRIEVGQLAKLCDECTENKKFTALAIRLGLESYLFLPTRSKPSCLADTYEALVGACFMGGGYEKAEAFVKRTFLDVEFPAS